MSTSLDERTGTDTDLNVTDGGDHDMFAHYTRKADIMKSAMSGDPVVALCGKVWTPGRDPQKFGVCPECKEVYETMKE
jgi:hypothetical protein